MPSTPYRPIISTQADLEDDRPLPQLTELADLPGLPTALEGRQFTHFLTTLSRSIAEARFAFLLTRPGCGGPDEIDRSWAALLYDVAREADAPCEVVHVATDDTVAPIPLDDLDVTPIGA